MRFDILDYKKQGAKIPSVIRVGGTQLAKVHQYFTILVLVGKKPVINIECIFLNN